MVKLSLEEYEQIGHEFKVLRSRLNNALEDLLDIFDVVTVHSLNQAIIALEKTRDKLEERLYRDYWYHGCEEYFRGGHTIRTIKFPCKRHSELTFDEYKLIGDEIKDLEKMYIELAIKSQMLHGKTLVRPMLDGMHKFSTLRSELEIVMHHDLRYKPHGELLDVFY